MTKIRVGIHGAGTVGKRVLEAVSKQDDMEIVGYTKTKPDYTTEYLSKYDLYTEFPENFKDSNVKVEGSLEELLEKSDIIIDATPKNSGYKPLYEKYGIKAIFQGGEKEDIGVSFIAQCNYYNSWGEDYVRIVSCNTTGLSRTLYAIDEAYTLGNVNAQLIRRGADPRDSQKGPINQIVPVIKKGEEVHGHHGPDVKTIMPDIQIYSMAVAVPTSIMHLHMIQAEVKENVTEEDIIELLKKTPRLRLLKHKDGFRSTGDIMEYAKYLNSDRRSDMPEVVIWEDSIKVEGNRVMFYQAVHQEAIIVPENVDAIRSMFKLMSSEESIKKTNETMNLKE
ncbi:MAG: type II glyceraldehyde-3-phosphate dehydrogenase [Nanoarchaeota archaeon]|nr:type II glyceraldehyde-3-phosphate dehydrogenase [Nanoarchaeota archaeon]